MKTSETTKEKFRAIAQSYMGMEPKDKNCATWGDMQRKMADEFLEVLEDRPEEMFYIKNGYVGNSILWWGKDSSGYTTHFLKAGKYPKDKAIEIINNRPHTDCAWSCWHVDHNIDAHVLTVEIGNLDRDFRLKGKEI